MYLPELHWLVCKKQKYSEACCCMYYDEIRRIRFDITVDFMVSIPPPWDFLMAKKGGGDLERPTFFPSIYKLKSTFLMDGGT